MLRDAWRSLAAARWTVLAAAGTLALGTGANIAVLSVAYGALWRPLPFADADRIVIVATGPIADPTPDQTVSLEELGQWREGLRSVEDLAGWWSGEFTVRGFGAPAAIRTAVVTPNFFDVFNFSGRRSDLPSTLGTDVVVISREMASRIRATGLDPQSATLTLGSASFRVGAVLPAAFKVPDDAELWVRSDAVAAVTMGSGRDFRSYRMAGRLAPGVTLAQASDDASRLLREIEAARGRQHERRVELRPIRDQLVGETKPVLAVFVAAAALLLIVACANVATIMVNRAMRRRRELAVRLAIGASPARLVGTAIVESFVIAAAGSAVGLLLAWYGIAALMPLTEGALPRAAAVSLNWPLLAIGTALTLVVTVLAGAGPALAAARSDFSQAFRTVNSSPSPTGRRTRAALVVIQMAMAVVLLVGASLLARTVSTLLARDLGVDGGQTLTLRLRLTETTRFDNVDEGPFVEELLRRLRELPGVEAAGISSNLPPRTAQIAFTLRVENATGAATTQVYDFGSASSGFFEAIGARLVRGRWFEPRDQLGEPVMVLSESAARQLAINGDPMDRGPFAVMAPSGDRVRPRVIGVIADVQHQGLEAQPNGSIYLRRAELPTGLAFLVVRTDGAPEALAPSLLRVLRDLDPGLPLPEPRTLEQEVHRAMIDRELRLALVGAFALVAVALAVAGLVGALSCTVTERRREMAIRAVLGATPRSAMARVLIDGAVLAVAGLAIGLAASVALGRSIATLLYGVSPFDPWTFGGVAGAVGLVVALAAWLPARRAARVQPLELLRSE
jgi:predicted permease